MSERTTWGICPRCGGRAVIGWEAVVGHHGESAGERPIDVNCYGGCDFADPQGLAALQE